AGGAAQVVANMVREGVCGGGEDRQPPLHARAERPVRHRWRLPGGRRGGLWRWLVGRGGAAEREERGGEDRSGGVGHRGSHGCPEDAHDARGARHPGQDPAFIHILAAISTRKIAKLRCSVVPLTCCAARAPNQAPIARPAAMIIAALRSTWPRRQYSMAPRSPTGRRRAASEVPVALWIGKPASPTRAATITTPPPMPNSPLRTPAPRPTSVRIRVRRRTPCRSGPAAAARRRTAAG